MKEFYYDKRGIYYKTNTFESGRPTLVFIHGLSASSIYWSEYIPVFQDKYNIIFLDLRGHGKSLKYKKYSDYKISKSAEDIFELVKHLGIEKFILVSHSFGTIVATEFLTSHQDMVSGVVLLSPGLSTARGLSGYLMRFVLGLAGFLESIVPIPKTGSHVDFIKFKGTGDWGVKRLWADLSSTTLRVYLYTLRQMYFFDKDNFFEKISIPTLIVHGNKDTYFPIRNSIEISSRIKGSEFVIIDDADHIIVLNNVKEVSTAILKFIEKNYESLK